MSAARAPSARLNSSPDFNKTCRQCSTSSSRRAVSTATNKAWHDGNGHSHLQATMLGPSLTVPIKEGNLVLGAWQQVFHLECDVKPRQRTIVITVMGEE